MHNLLKEANYLHKLDGHDDPKKCAECGGKKKSGSSPWVCCFQLAVSMS